jgi:hypothetical protein
MTYAKQMKEAIRGAIERKFGEISDSGCYSGIGGEWMSTQRFFDLVCDTIDDNDWLFGDDD